MIMQRLLCENAVNALMSRDRLGTYVEYRKSSSGELFQGYYDDDVNMIFWNGAAPRQHDALMPFILFALHKDSPFPEAREAFRKLASHYVTSGSVDEGEIYQLCDDFYYEMKNRYGALTLDVDYTFDIETIRQSCRTGQMEEVELFRGINVPDLEVTKGISMPRTEVEESSCEIDYAQCKMGSYILDNVWELGQEEFIPPLNRLDKFVPVPAYYTMVNLINNEIKEVLRRRDEGIKSDR